MEQWIAPVSSSGPGRNRFFGAMREAPFSKTSSQANKTGFGADQAERWLVSESQKLFDDNRRCEAANRNCSKPTPPLEPKEEKIGQKASNKKERRWKSSPFHGLNVFNFEDAPIFDSRTNLTSS
jgi:hypothetical protein